MLLMPDNQGNCQIDFFNTLILYVHRAATVYIYKYDKYIIVFICVYNPPSPRKILCFNPYLTLSLFTFFSEFFSRASKKVIFFIGPAFTLLCNFVSLFFQMSTFIKFTNCICTPLYFSGGNSEIDAQVRSNLCYLICHRTQGRHKKMFLHYWSYN